MGSSGWEDCLHIWILYGLIFRADWVSSLRDPCCIWDFLEAPAWVPSCQPLCSKPRFPSRCRRCRYFNHTWEAAQMLESGRMEPLNVGADEEIVVSVKKVSLCVFGFVDSVRVCPVLVGVKRKVWSWFCEHQIYVVVLIHTKFINVQYMKPSELGVIAVHASQSNRGLFRPSKPIPRNRGKRMIMIEVWHMPCGLGKCKLSKFDFALAGMGMPYMGYAAPEMMPCMSLVRAFLGETGPAAFQMALQLFSLERDVNGCFVCCLFAWKAWEEALKARE